MLPIKKNENVDNLVLRSMQHFDAVYVNESFSSDNNQLCVKRIECYNGMQCGSFNASHCIQFQFQF